MKQMRGRGGWFDDRAIRCQIAFQYLQRILFFHRGVELRNYIKIQTLGIFCYLTNRPTGDGHCLGVQMRPHLAHQRRQTTCAVEFFSKVFAVRQDIHQEWYHAAVALEIFKRQLNPNASSQGD
ncbi:hypothetical protein D3C79_759150 [compost metagenome]